MLNNKFPGIGNWSVGLNWDRREEAFVKYMQ